MMYRRKERAALRAQGLGEYHFATDGWKEGKIFNNAAEYAFGMILMGLICLRFAITIHAFSLMPNHIHIVIRGTGEEILKAFDYLKRKLKARLKRDGYRPIPETYWFKLVKIDSPEQMRTEIIYVLRNALEHGLGAVGGYLWCSAWLYHSDFCEMLHAEPEYKLSKRKKYKLFGGRENVPSHWRFHPYLGLIPDAFVDTSLVMNLFPEAKDLQVALVKDYEAIYQAAGRLGEIVAFNKAEMDSIVSQTVMKRFPGQSLRSLSDADKAKLAIILHREFGLNSYQISKSIYIKEVIVRQLLNSKDLR